jgi:hypothetical protein
MHFPGANKKIKNIFRCLNQKTNSTGYEKGMLHSSQYREPGLFADRVTGIPSHI